MRPLSRAHSLLLIVITFVRFSCAADCTAEAFRSILPSNASVNVIAQVQGPNGSFGDLGDKDFPALAYNLPELCAVSIKITIPGNTFNFGLFLPAKWNQRLIGTGNTGFGGGINYPAMGRLVHYGMVAFSTDTGHNSGPTDASWAFRDDTKQNDWGFYAMHESIVMAKHVVAEFYGHTVKHSYYMACSGGGRQGMKEMQQYPEDFNGYAIGAPPWLLSHLHPWATYIGAVNLPTNTPAHIDKSLLSSLTANITRICDPQDGLSDGTIAQPWTCNFSPSMLLCSATSGPICLTNAQIPTFNKLFGAWNDSHGALLFPSLMLGADISGLAGGSTPPAFGTAYIDNFIYNNTHWNPLLISPETVTSADLLDPGSSNAAIFNLAPFRATGGKAIMYHGLADSLIPPGSTIDYFTQAQAANPAIEDFLRLFLIPGMHHCSASSKAPFFIAGGGQEPAPGTAPPFSFDGKEWPYSVPGFVDARHDIVLALIAWVEQGIAPDSLIASKFTSESGASAGNGNGNGDGKGLVLSGQYPLCPYPQRAVYQGPGPADQSANWHCAPGEALGLPRIEIASSDDGGNGGTGACAVARSVDGLAMVDDAAVTSAVTDVRGMRFVWLMSLVWTAFVVVLLS